MALTRGREGVQNPEILADVICTCPLRGYCMSISVPSQCHPFVRERFSAATEALDVDDSDVLDSLTEPLSESRDDNMNYNNMYLQGDPSGW